MNQNNHLVLSPLPHTWFLDLDGTILLHNGYKDNGIDSFVSGAEEFLKSLPAEDKIIFVTSRLKKYQEVTESFLHEHNIKFSEIIYEIPYGERIVINDSKPSGLQTAIACCVNRNTFDVSFLIDKSK